jgi:peptidoglycan/LPS O-acetylase OafA/YrhL
LRSLPYRPELDGLRAFVALAFVLHPSLGLAAFFVVSGAFLTQLLLHELDGYEAIRYGRFLKRRARRLVPAAIPPMIAALAVKAPIDRGAMIVFASFTVAWPLLLWGTWKIGRSVAILALVLFVLAWNALRLNGLAIDVPADALAIGSLAGIGVRLGAARGQKTLVSLAGLALFVLAFAVHAHWTSPWPITSVLVAIVVMRLFVAPSLFFAFEPLVVLGRLAYGTWLWLAPVVVFAHARGWPWLADVPIVLLLAAGTHWGIERPLRLKWRKR